MFETQSFGYHFAFIYRLDDTNKLRDLLPNFLSLHRLGIIIRENVCSSTRRLMLIEKTDMIGVSIKTTEVY